MSNININTNTDLDMTNHNIINCNNINCVTVNSKPPSLVSSYINIVSPTWTGSGPFNLLTITPNTGKISVTCTLGFSATGALFSFSLNSSLSGIVSQIFTFPTVLLTSYNQTLSWVFDTETIGSPTTISLNSHSGNPFSSVNFASVIARCI